ncbi:permease-like cell division protein FtsX [Alkalicoccus halolimnae]|uniref:Cell division protein FtsX n=1 Tax=Alkalicoccus halolimnae TaxID=1667239 RepID=A0AAJ8N2I2_9BACI|nr:permease-like cell division protein FtsX [Alkalicoccus halolimnae]
MRREPFAERAGSIMAELIRNKWLTLASTSAMTVTLFIVGAFAILLVNGFHFTDALEEKMELRVFIADEAVEMDKNLLQKQIIAFNSVKQIEYVTKEEALEQFLSKIGEEEEDYFDALRHDNPLNDFIIVNIKELDSIKAAAEEIAAMANVEKISYGEEIAGKIVKASGIVQNTGLLIGSFLIFAAIVLVTNTMKLTSASRKEERKVMLLLGASISSIRCHYAWEGLFIGFFSALIPIVLLNYIYERIYESSYIFGNLLPGGLLSPQLFHFPLACALLLLGSLIGIGGSLAGIKNMGKDDYH